MFCFIIFSLSAITVAVITNKPGEHKVDENLQVPLFQEKIWPESIRSYFKIVSSPKYPVNDDEFISREDDLKLLKQ